MTVRAEGSPPAHAHLGLSARYPRSTSQEGSGRNVNESVDMVIRRKVTRHAIVITAVGVEMIVLGARIARMPRSCVRTGGTTRGRYSSTGRGAPDFDARVRDHRTDTHMLPALPL